MHTITESSEYIIASFLRPGMITELGTIEKVLPMGGFSSMQVRVAGRKSPIVLDKEASIIVDNYSDIVA